MKRSTHRFLPVAPAIAILMGTSTAISFASQALPEPAAIRSAAEKALPILQKSPAEYTHKQKCFSCHHQALPALAVSTAKEHGLEVDPQLLSDQVKFTEAFLLSNKANYLQGKGQGGQTTTAGYALWTLDMGGRKPDDGTTAVAEYLLQHNQELDHWRATSNRPPSEVSPFTDTFLALRGLRVYGTEAQKERITARVEKVRGWLLQTPAKDTEDRVFRLWGLKEAGAETATAAEELKKTQRPDGGWSQTSEMHSDAYATGSALVALHEAGGLSTDSSQYRGGLAFLIANQKPDGTWYVKSRSKPFQPYFESGFPYGTDQFISSAASGWAAAALALAVKPGR